MQKCDRRRTAISALLAGSLLWAASCQLKPTAASPAAPSSAGDPGLSESGRKQLQAVGIPVVLPEYVPPGFSFTTLSGTSTKALKEYEVTYSRRDPAAALVIHGTSNERQQPASFNSTDKSIYVSALGQTVTLPAFRDGATGDFDSGRFNLRAGKSAPNYYWLSFRNMEISEVERTMHSLRLVPMGEAEATPSPESKPKAEAEPAPASKPAPKPPIKRPDEVILAPPPVIGAPASGN